jgi:hypothetical protein
MGNRAKNKGRLEIERCISRQKYWLNEERFNMRFKHKYRGSLNFPDPAYEPAGLIPGLDGGDRWRAKNVNWKTPRYSDQITSKIKIILKMRNCWLSGIALKRHRTIVAIRESIRDLVEQTEKRWVSLGKYWDNGIFLRISILIQMCTIAYFRLAIWRDRDNKDLIWAADHYRDSGTNQKKGGRLIIGLAWMRELRHMRSCAEFRKEPRLRFLV